jgi:2-amino-4-hydroxy-6-hydroxymethyldihydropteridine diphosphokinase
MNKAYLLIGGNMGDRLNYLKRACNAIISSVGNIVMLSSVYETDAWGIEDQPAFVNQALLVKTSFSPQDLLKQLLATEEMLGRKRTIKYGARIIDIDILFFNNDIINEHSLTIPHPAVQHRRFALVPLNEIAPNLHHPVLKKTITQLLQECSDTLQVRMLGS